MVPADYKIAGLHNAAAVAAPAAAACRYIEVDIDVTTCKTAGYIVQVREHSCC
jgi:hypothetical protein